MSDSTISAVSATQQTVNFAYSGATMSAARAAAKDAAPVAKVAPVQLSGKSAGTANSTSASNQVGKSAPINAIEPGKNNNIAEEDPKVALEQVREHVKQVVPELDFSIDEDTGRIVVKLLDTATDEVLRQIPSEEVLHIAKMLDKLQGLLLREKA